MEYVNVLFVSPLSLTAIGLPFESNTSRRPDMADPELFTRAICVAHPPEIANCGMISAVAPPTVPGSGVLGLAPAVSVEAATPGAATMIATGKVLNTGPEN